MEITRQVALKLARENGVTEPSSSAINRFAQAANDLSKPEIENLNARITELEGEIERLKFVHQVAVTAWEEADSKLAKYRDAPCVAYLYLDTNGEECFGHPDGYWPDWSEEYSKPLIVKPGE